jgi:hypothetical protein
VGVNFQSLTLMGPVSFREVTERRDGSDELASLHEYLEKAGRSVDLGWCENGRVLI